MSDKKQRRIKEKTAKDLYNLAVEYVYHRSQPVNQNRKKELFNEYNDRWTTYCFNQRRNKAVVANTNGFKNIIGSIRQVRTYQRMLGLPEEKISLLQRIFS